MPNQNNYRTDLTKKTESRFTTSRIVNVPDDVILNEEIPASFGFDTGDNIEIHFYTAVGNQLLLSVLIGANEDIIKSHIVAYNDGTYKNYIRIDFTKLFLDKELILVPGDYRMVLNFFSDEIGSYTNRKLQIDTISDSSTEVQLSFSDTTDNIRRQENLYLLKEFVDPSIDKINAAATMDKIFKSGVELNDETEGLYYTNILTQADLTLLQDLNIYGNFIDELHALLLDLGNFIKDDIVINGDDLIQKDEFQKLITSTVQLKLQTMKLKFQESLKLT